MDIFGNKARSLLELQNLGLNVPSFFVIDTSHFMNFLKREGEGISNETKNWLQQQLQELGNGPWAVRSSSTKEDGQEHSFAGLFESYLDLKTVEDVLVAIEACWISACSERVLTYCERFGINPAHINMAVIVQKYITAEVAGVLFTAHPTTGNDKEMLIEACRGSGEKLVSGLVNPSRYRISWFGSSSTLSGEENDHVYLSPEELSSLREIGRKVQSHYGLPQDIEFAIKDQLVYVVQSRPITRLQYGRELGEWTTADFRDGGVSASVVSPLMWSLYSSVFSSSLPQYFQNIKLIDAIQAKETTWFQVFYGRPYWNLQAVKDIMMTLPDFNERNFDQDLSIPPTYTGNGRTTPLTIKGVWAAIPTLFALRKEFSRQLKQSEELLHIFEKIETHFLSLKLECLSDSEFSSEFANLLEEHFRVESQYFKTIYNASNAKLEFMSRLKAYKKACPQLEYVHLISDLGESTATQPANELREIAEIFRSSDNLYHLEQLLEHHPLVPLRALEQLPSTLSHTLTGFIQKFYYHSEKELDLRVPRWIENARFVCTTLKSLMMASGPSVELQRQKSHTYQTALALLKAAHQHTWFNIIPGGLQNTLEKLNRVRRFLWLREELRCCSSKIYYFIRQFSLELARRKGISSSQNPLGHNLVFYSSQIDLLKLAKDEISLTEFLEHAQESACYANGYAHFNAPNEIGYRYNNPTHFHVLATPAPDAPTLQGIGCSAGRIKARARVISDISQAADLQAGEILVTRFTDPGWTPLFSLASGVICETGGLLSHAALISREYGIPSVLNVPSATRLIQNGQEIELDGTCGEVYLQ